MAFSRWVLLLLFLLILIIFLLLLKLLLMQANLYNPMPTTIPELLRRM